MAAASAAHRQLAASRGQPPNLIATLPPASILPALAVGHRETMADLREIRELEEELGIETESACLAPAAFASHSVDGSHLILLLYVCRKWRGTPRPLDASALTWVRPQQMFSLAMPPAEPPSSFFCSGGRSSFFL